MFHLVKPVQVNTFIIAYACHVLSKLRERHVCAQLRLHLQSNDIEDPFQSVYRPANSVETAIVCIQDNDSRSLVGKHVVLVLLGPSTAFGTIDHDGCRSNWRARRRNLLGLILSYRANRVRQCGRSLIPQNPTMTRSSTGQCLGSFTFHCVLCWPVRCLRVLRCSLTCLYADATQLYVDFPPNDSASTADQISRCVVDVKV